MQKVLHLKDESYVLDIVHARIPLRNDKARRWAEILGFRSVGILPGAVWMGDAKKLEPAWVGWATRETIGEAGC